MAQRKTVTNSLILQRSSLHKDKHAAIPLQTYIIESGFACGIGISPSAQDFSEILFVGSPAAPPIT